MKTLIKKTIVAATSIIMVATSAQAQSKPKKPTPAPQKLIVKKIDSIQDYLNLVDLERVYMNGENTGSVSIFIAAPSAKTAKSGGKREHIVSQYLKANTGLVINGYVEQEYDEETGDYKPLLDNADLLIPMGFRPSDDTASAKMDENHGMNYACVNDGNINSAKMDISSINADYVSAAKPRSLTDADKAVLFGGTVPATLSADQQAKLTKAEIASGKLFAMVSGFRMIPIPRGGYQTNCQAIKNSVQQVTGSTIVNRLIPLENAQNSDVDVYAVWYNGTEKDVVVNGQKVKAVVDAKGNILKADAINVRQNTIEGSGPDVYKTLNQHIWVKRTDSKLHNSAQLVSLYTDLGYTYTKAAVAANTGAPPSLPTLKYCGLVVKDKKYNLIAIQDNQYDLRVYPKGTKVPVFGGTTQDLKVYTEISDADAKALSKMQCGCLQGISTGISTSGTEANDYEDGVSLPYFFQVVEGSAETKKATACKNIDKTQELNGFYGGDFEGD